MPNLQELADQVRQSNQAAGYTTPTPQYNLPSLGGLGGNTGFSPLSNQPVSRENAPMRQMTGTENYFAKLSGIANDMATYFDFGGGQASSPADIIADPRKGAAFLANLPGGMASAALSGPVGIYEGITGTPVSSMANLDTNQVSSYKYDANERAAAGLSGGIDLVGLALGGTGRLIGAGAGAIGKAAGIVDNPIAKGWVKKATGSTLGQIGFDVLEEGAEEFSQSVLDDVKNANIDDGIWNRALNAGALGAIGGGVMSGGAHAINRMVFGPQDNSSDSEVKSQSEGTSTQGKVPGASGTPIEWESDRSARQSYFGSTAINSVAEQVLDREKENTVVPGASQTMNVYQDDNATTAIRNKVGTNMIEATMGIDDIRASYLGNHPDSRRSVAQAFVSNVNGHDLNWAMSELDKACNTRNPKAGVAIVNNMLSDLEKDGHYVEFAIGRNPRTNQAGFAKMRLAGISDTRNSGLGMSAMAYTMFGMDIDGDITQCFFSDNVPEGNYLTELIIDGSLGMPTYKNDYFIKIAGSKNIKRISDGLDSTVSNIENMISKLRGANLTAEQKQMISDANSALAQVKDFRSRLPKSTKGSMTFRGTTFDLDKDGKSLAAGLAHCFDEIREAARKVSVVSGQGDSAASKFSNELVADLMEDYDRAPEISETFKELKKKAKNGIRFHVQEMPPAVQEAIQRAVTTSGTTNASHILQAFQDMGWHISMNTDDGNPYFRQSMGIYLHDKPGVNVQLDWKNYGFTSRYDAFRQMTAFAFRLTGVGLEVENALEGIFKSTVVAQVDSRWATLSSEEKSFKSLLSIFQEMYADVSEDFNKAFEETGNWTDGVKLDLDKVKKRKLSGDTDALLAQEFLRAFGDIKISDYVSIPASDTFVAGRTFNQAVEKTKLGPSSSYGEFAYDEDLSKFWPTLVNQYQSNEIQIGHAANGMVKRVTEAFKDNNIIAHTKETRDADGKITSYEIDDEYSLLVHDAVDCCSVLLSPKMMDNLGLRTVEGFLTSTWGQAFISGDEKLATNAMWSMSLTDQYAPLIDLLVKEGEDNVAKNEAYMNTIRTYVTNLRGVSTIHHMIAESIAGSDAPDFSILKRFTSLDVSYDAKLNLYSMFTGTEKGDPDRLTADIMKTGSDSLELSKVSKRVARAETMLSSITKNSESIMQDQMHQIKELVQTNQATKAEIFDAFKYSASENMVSFSTRHVSSFIFSNLDLVKDWVEKGVSTDSATMIDLMLEEQIKGGKMSFVGDMYSALGSMTVEYFAQSRPALTKILFDPKAEIRLHTPTRDGHLVIRQADFYEYITGRKLKNVQKGPDADEFFDMLEKCPKLLSILSPQQVIPMQREDGSMSAASKYIDKPADWVRRYCDQTDPNFFQRLHEKQARNWVSSVLFEKPGFWEALGAMCDGIDRFDSLEEAEGVVEENLRKLQNHFLHRMSLGQGQEFKYWAERYRNRQVLNHLNTVTDGVASLTIAGELNRLSNNIMTNNMPDLFENGFTFFDTLSLIKKINDANITVTGIDGQPVLLGDLAFIGTSPDGIQGVSGPLGSWLKNYDSVIAANAIAWQMLDPSQQTSALSLGKIQDNRDKLKSWMLSKVKNQHDIDTINLAFDTAQNQTQADFETMKRDLSSGFHSIANSLYSAQLNTSGNSTATTISQLVLDESKFDNAASVDDAIANVKEIFKTTGTYDYTSKTEDAIRKAFKDNNARVKFELRRRFNAELLKYLMNDAMHGSGVRTNPEANYMEMLQYDNLDSLYDDLVRAYNEDKPEIDFDRLNITSEPLKFGYNSPVTTALATACRMNANAAPVGSGIGTDGSESAILGGFAFLPKDFKSWAKGASATNVRNNLMSASLYDFLCWAQETQFLKMKKSEKRIKTITRHISLSHNLNKEHSISTADLQSSFQSFFDKERSELAGAYKTLFSDENAKDLGFDKNPTLQNLWASVTTPYIEVSYVVNGELKRGIINSAVFEDQNLLAQDPVWKEMQGASKVTARMPVVSLGEISSKIIRSLNSALSNKGEALTRDEIESTAVDAISDWSSYGENGFDIGFVLGRIPYNGRAFDAAAKADLARTPVQAFYSLQKKRHVKSNYDKWSEIGVFDRPSDGKTLTTEEKDECINRTNEFLEDVRNQVANLNIATSFANGLIDKSFGDNNVIVSITEMDRSDSLTSAPMSKLIRNFPKNKFKEAPSAIWQGSNKYNAVEMIYYHDFERAMAEKSSVTNVVKKINEANKRGHRVLVNYDMLQYLVDYLPPSVLDDAMNSAVLIGDKVYSCIDLSAFQNESPDVGTTLMSCTKMDKRQINIGIGITGGNIPDAGIGANPHWKTLGEINQSYRDSLTSFMRGEGMYELVTDPDEIIRACNSITDPNNQNSVSVVMDKWTKKSEKLSLDTLRSNVGRYAKYVKANRWAGDTIPAMSNVMQGDCIGFIKQDHYGVTYYSPIFFESSNAPKRAKSVQVEFDRHGSNVVINYKSGIMDFRKGAVKMALYQMPYKGIATMVSEEGYDDFFPLIDAKGYDILVKDNSGGQSSHYVFDYSAWAGRSYGFDRMRLINNLYYTSLQIPSNLFFTGVEKNGNLDKKKNLNVSDDMLADLCNGRTWAWRQVASGSATIFDGSTPELSKLNDAIMDLTAEILFHGGRPELFFCPTMIKRVDGKWENYGQHMMAQSVHPAFTGATQDKILSIFNAMNKDLCPESVAKSAGPDTTEGRKWIFDHEGNMLRRTSTAPNGWERVCAIVGPSEFMHQNTLEGMDSGIARYGFQQQIGEGLQYGLFDQTMNDMIEYLSLKTSGIMTERQSLTADQLISQMVGRMKDGEFNISPIYSKDIENRVKAVFENSVPPTLLSRHKAKCRGIIKDLMGPNFHINMPDNKKSVTDDPAGQARIESAISKLNDALRATGKSRLTFRECVVLVRLAIGHSNDTHMSLDTITVNQFEDAIDHIVNNVNNGRLPIDGDSYTGYSGDPRVRIPMIPANVARRLYETPAYSENSAFPTFADFTEATAKQMHDVTRIACDSLSNNAKRIALENMCDAVAYDNGYDSQIGFVAEGVNPREVVKSIERFGGSIPGLGFDFVSEYEQFQADSTKEYNKLMNLEKNRSLYIGSSSDGETKVTYSGVTRDSARWVLNNLIELRKAMGQTYFGLLPGNVIERGVHTAQTSFVIKLGQSGIGPFAMDKTHVLSNSVINRAVNDENFIKLFVAFRTAQRLGLGNELISNLHNIQDVQEAITKTIKQQTLLEKINDTIVDVAQGKNIFIKSEMKNFVAAFNMYASREGHSWWFQPGSNGLLNLENALDNPARWFTSLFTGTDGKVSADYNIAMRSLNLARSGDMAQKSLATAIYTEWAKYHTATNFLVCTLENPYVNYGITRFGRIANMVAPISSLHWLLTKSAMSGALGEIVIGKNGEQQIKIKDIPLDDVQIYNSLTTAFMADMMKIGPTMLALLLLSIIGGVEPPDDEDKWGNFKEWKFLGLRGDFAWWMEDVLGLTLPVAAFMRSCQLGKPRFDLIINGFTYYLGNNPVVKVTDAVQAVFDPLAEIQEDYAQDKEGYAKALGGPPTASDFFNGKGKTFLLSYIAQFITPGFLREIYNEGQRFEVSYKKVYQTDASGQLTKEGDVENRTMYTDYADAIVRKYTRFNPFMGFLADLVLRPETGYMAHEMPRTVYYDPFEMNSIEALSIYNDPFTKQDPKSYTEQLAVANQVVVLLQTYSVEELRKQGFMLDSDTRAFVSEFIHDQIASLKNQWYTARQNGELDYYALGSTFAEGRERYYELYKNHNAQVQAWQDLYYDKLWNDDLTKMTQYNRYATNYATDQNGNVYATGYKASNFLPYTLAPTPSDEDGSYRKVMGPEDDYAAQSVLTGASTGQRGLIPAESGYVETPNIDSWGEDGTDTSYSKTRVKNDPSARSTVASDTSSSSSNSSGSRGGSGYARRSYGGSGGGRSGGGGGGYSRISTPYTGSGSSVYGSKFNDVRPQSTSYDYLRPNVETKGSRDPYKRSN